VTSLLLVDDQDLVRMGLRTLFDHEDGFTVVGEAADGLAAVRDAATHRPDVILMDIRMRGSTGSRPPAGSRLTPTSRGLGSSS
jgi:DNA-binding NarL/FixJ family response regulator